MSRKLAALFGALLVGAALVGTGVAVAGMSTDAPSEVGPTAEPNDGPARTIEVSTTGEAQAQPDEAVVRLAVRATAEDPTTARSRVAENVSRMKAALAELGIDEKRIRTVDFDLRERRERRPKGDEEPELQYWASHDLVIEVEEIDRVGEVIDTAIDSGATDVHDVRFTLAEETRRELRTQALEDAMSNARQQADTIAENADLAIAGVHSASTADVRIPYQRATPSAAMAGADGGSTDISSGPVSVTATVHVTYNATGS